MNDIYIKKLNNSSTKTEIEVSLRGMYLHNGYEKTNKLLRFDWRHKLNAKNLFLMSYLSIKFESIIMLIPHKDNLIRIFSCENWDFELRKYSEQYKGFTDIMYEVISEFYVFIQCPLDFEDSSEIIFDRVFNCLDGLSRSEFPH